MSSLVRMQELEEPVPEISACVICYNQQEYIAECLNSILEQKFENFDVVVYDDCSTDETWQRILAIAATNPRIRAFRQSENVGFQENSRAAFKACSGKYIAVCEGDDYWLDPLKLSKQAALMKKHSAVFGFASASRIDPSGKMIGTIDPGLSPGVVDHARFLALGGSVPTPTILFSRSHVLSAPEEIYHQPVLDVPLQTVLAAMGPVVYCPDILSARRIEARGSWTEALIRDPGKYHVHHQRSRDMEKFLAEHLPQACRSRLLTEMFRPGIKYFYQTSRIPRAVKRTNLARDWNRADWKLKATMVLFSYIPGLSKLGSFIRKLVSKPDERYRHFS